MANTYTNLNDLFTAIANAIRTKTGTTEAIIADTFPIEIKKLRTGFDYVNQDVTVIPDYAFYGCEDLNNVDCYNLTSVGVSAFENCINLKTIILYDSVETVGENAFKGCDNIIIYYKGTSIPEGWHENWNPDGNVVICGEPIATWDASATENDDVTVELYNDIFNAERRFLCIKGYGDMKQYSYTGAIPWNKYASSIGSAVVEDGITTLSFGIFHSCSNLTNIILSNTILTIEESVFSRCSSLTNITIPDSVISIGSYVFQNCTSLTSIIIPDGVTEIGTKTFEYCSNLMHITIPYNITHIGYDAFRFCFSLTSITYTGTIAQWNAIKFDTDWNLNTPDYTIHCTDGDIAKDGTITYH